MSTLRLLGLFGAFWGKVWALLARVLDDMMMRVQAPQGKKQCFFANALEKVRELKHPRLLDICIGKLLST